MEMEGVKVIPYGRRWGVTYEGRLMKTFQYKDFAIAYANDSARADAIERAQPDREVIKQLAGRPWASSETDRRCSGVTCVETGQSWLTLAGFLEESHLSQHITRTAQSAGGGYVMFKWSGNHYIYKKKKRQRSESRAVICDETGRRFTSAAQAADEMGLDYTAIYKYCRGLRLAPVKGYTFRFEEE